MTGSPSANPLTSLNFSPDGLTLIAETQTENVYQWTMWKISDLEHPVTTTSMPAWCEAECPRNIYFASPYQVVAASSPDGKMQVTGGTDKTVSFWDDSSDTPVRISPLMQGHSNFVNRVAWSNDGKIIASGDEDGNILLWSPPIFAPLSVSTETPAKGVDVSFWDRRCGLGKGQGRRGGICIRKKRPGHQSAGQNVRNELGPIGQGWYPAQHVPLFL